MEKQATEINKLFNTKDRKVWQSRGNSACISTAMPRDDIDLQTIFYLLIKQFKFYE